MKLQAVDRPAEVPHRGDRAGVGRGQGDEIAADGIAPGRRGSSRRSSPARRPRTGRCSRESGTIARPNSRDRRRLHLAAEHLAGELHPVADAEDRNAEIEDAGIALRRTRLVDAGRPAGEDDAARLATRRRARPTGRAARPGRRRSAREHGGRSTGRTASRNRGPGRARSPALRSCPLPCSLACRVPATASSPLRPRPSGPPAGRRAPGRAGRRSSSRRGWRPGPSARRDAARFPAPFGPRRGPSAPPSAVATSRGRPTRTPPSLRASITT